MAAGKWIPDLRPNTPLADAARHVLMVRLNVVREYLPLAIHQAHDSVEHVHQLRVGTRRARAAIDIFSPCLPVKAARAARKELRRIRGLAGDARDWDVFQSSLAAWAQDQPPRNRPAADFLFGLALTRRELAQEHLRAAADIYPFQFDRRMADTVAAIHKPQSNGPKLLLDLARPMLQNLLDELNSAGSHGHDDPDHLHQVRIIGKQVRYAMEVFVDCFDPIFRDQLYPAVEQMQEILGAANDSQVAGAWLQELAGQLEARHPGEWKRLRPGLTRLIEHHKRRSDDHRSQFERWWHDWTAEPESLACYRELMSDSNSPQPKHPVPFLVSDSQSAPTRPDPTG